MAATAPASDRPELQRIDRRLCVYTCVHASAGGVRAPVASRRHLGATKPDWGPEASPSARHTHAIEFIMSLGDGVRERLPLSAEVMEALDWCSAADEAGERLVCVCRMCVWLAPNCTTHIKSDSVSSHTLLSVPVDWQDKTLQVQPYTVSDQDSLPLRCHPPFEPYTSLKKRFLFEFCLSSSL